MDGGPAGASTNMPGRGASVYTPTAQGTADTGFQNIANNFYNQAASGSTPGQFYYPQVQSAVGNIYSNPFAGAAQNQAGIAADMGNQFGGSQVGGAYGLQGAAGAGLPFTGQALGAGFSPEYGQVVNAAESNPFLGGMIGGASGGAAYGASAADQAASTAGALGGYASTIPGMANIAGGNISGMAPTVAGYGASAAAPAGYLQGLGREAGSAISGAAGPLQGVSGQILNTGFDPQQALYDRTQQRVLDQQNAVNSMSGIASTPYGAGVAGDALRNFNIDWQNQQLARQTQAAQAAQGVQGQIGGLEALGANTASGLQTAAGNLYGQGGSLANTAGGLYGAGLNADVLGANTAANLGATAYNLGSGASGLAASSAALPTAAYQSNLSNITSALDAQNRGGLLGANAYSGLLGGSGAGLANAGNVGVGGLSAIQNAGNLPYNTANTIGGNQLSGIGQGIGLGNQQYTLPQQLLNDLQSYLGLGQSASTISGNLGNMGLQQLGNAASGLGGLAGNVFGSNGPFSSGGALGGLFGGGGSGASAGGAFGGGGGVANEIGNLTGAAAEVGGGSAGGGIGSILGSILPFAAS